MRPTLSAPPAISVQIPVYNAAPYLRECLDSVLGQTFTDFEVICVDDGSSDLSSVIVQDYARRDSRIKLFTHTTNLGTLQARKTAFRNSHGAFMSFVDADDVIHPLLFEKLIAKINETDADIVQFGCAILDPGEKITQEIRNSYEEYFSTISLKPIVGTEVFTSYVSSIKTNLCTSFISNNVYKSLTHYIPSQSVVHGNDNLLMFMATYFANKYVPLNEILYYYRASDTSSNLTIPDMKCLQAHIYSRSEVLHLAKDFILATKKFYDPQTPPVNFFNESAFNYCIELSCRVLEKNRKYLTQISALLQKCFGGLIQEDILHNSINESFYSATTSLTCARRLLTKKTSLYNLSVSNQSYMNIFFPSQDNPKHYEYTFCWPDHESDVPLTFINPLLQDIVLVFAMNIDQSMQNYISFTLTIDGEPVEPKILLNTKPSFVYSKIYRPHHNRIDTINIALEVHVKSTDYHQNNSATVKIGTMLSLHSLNVFSTTTPNMGNFPISHFDGFAYLKAYPDIAKLVSDRVFLSAAHHYALKGCDEGRHCFLAVSRPPTMGYRFEIPPQS
ncbi:glycosyltransferase family 2 protein [Solidesulfovibrio sp.]|uniref:glycosyltransferase family 2 protein n=1 Tax=Solidesulfovibrio sp. TaxID=2910990 RepID=UPI002615F1C1|nr:glycosyltransferase family 2 protein [Solidesulfovibrio sp.]